MASLYMYTIIIKFCHDSDIYVGGPNIPPEPTEFSSGDVVQVELDVEVFMLLQEDHGGWNDKMKTVRMLIIITIH